jgi:hypothetical protein
VAEWIELLYQRQKCRYNHLINARLQPCHPSFTPTQYTRWSSLTSISTPVLRQIYSISSRNPFSSSGVRPFWAHQTRQSCIKLFISVRSPSPRNSRSNTNTLSLPTLTFRVTGTALDGAPGPVVWLLAATRLGWLRGSLFGDRHARQLHVPVSP